MNTFRKWFGQRRCRNVDRVERLAQIYMLTRQGPGAAKGAKPSKTHVAPTWPEEHSSRNSDGASSRARGG